MLDSNVFTHVANRAAGHELIEKHMARGLVLVSDDRHLGTVPLLKLENWRIRVTLAPER